MPLVADRLSASYTAPSASFLAVTPSNSDNLDTPARALYVGTAGDVTVIGLDDNLTETIFKNVPAGTVLPVRVKRVKATGTTASDIVALL